MSKPIDAKTTARASFVISRLRALCNKIDNDFIEVGKLLHEASVQKLHECLGFSSVSEWLTSENVNLPVVTYRRILYVARRARKLNISEARLKVIGFPRAEIVLRATRAAIEHILEQAERGTNIRVLRELVAHSAGKRKSARSYNVTFTGLQEADYRLAETSIAEARSCLPSGVTRAECFRYILDAFMSYRISVTEKKAA